MSIPRQVRPRRGRPTAAMAGLLAAGMLLGILGAAVTLAFLDRDRAEVADRVQSPPEPEVPPDLPVVARFELDEPPGANELRDEVGGLVGRIGSQVATDRGHHVFAHVVPNSGWFPQHTDVVPPSRRLHRLLDPGAGTFMFTLRYQTRHSFGNIMQKGQGTAPGGYWKLENPGRAPRCMFRGGDGETRTGYLAGFEEGAQLSPGWHTLTCVRTPEWVQMWVDGVAQPRAWGASGVIENDYELSIGGKSSCDARKVTCDYFSGRIDWIEFRRG